MLEGNPQEELEVSTHRETGRGRERRGEERKGKRESGGARGEREGGKEKGERDRGTNGLPQPISEGTCVYPKMH